MLLRDRETEIVYTIGAVGYVFVELFWRGRSHWTMAFTGGLCFVLVYAINARLRTAKLWQKCVLGALVITFIELAVGCLVNRLLRMGVWDYSRMPLNLLGQICPQYTMLWTLLCIPLAFFSTYLRKRIHNAVQ